MAGQWIPDPQDFGGMFQKVPTSWGEEQQNVVFPPGGGGGGAVPQEGLVINPAPVLPPAIAQGENRPVTLPSGWDLPSGYKQAVSNAIQVIHDLPPSSLPLLSTKGEYTPQYSMYRDQVAGVTGYAAPRRNWMDISQKLGKLRQDKIKNKGEDLTPEEINKAIKDFINPGNIPGGGEGGGQDVNTISTQLANWQMTEAQAAEAAAKLGINFKSVLDKVSLLRTGGPVRSGSLYSYSGAGVMNPTATPLATQNVVRLPTIMHASPRGNFLTVGVTDLANLPVQYQPLYERVMRIAGWTPTSMYGTAGPMEFRRTGSGVITPDLLAQIVGGDENARKWLAWLLSQQGLLSSNETWPGGTAGGTENVTLPPEYAAPPA